MRKLDLKEIELIKTSNVYVILLVMEARNVFNLYSLWRSSDMKPSMEPRKWAKRRDYTEEVEWGEHGKVAITTHGVALAYAQDADPAVQIYFNKLFLESLHSDPVKHIMRDESGLSGLFAAREIIDQGDQLVAEAVERTEGMDDFAAETAVARVQRAVKRIKPA